MSLHEGALGLPKSESCEAIGLRKGPRAVSDGTTLLFGLPGVRVERVERLADGTRLVDVVTTEEAIVAMAADSEFTPVVARLGCLRGVSTLTAFGLAVEIGDWHRLTGRSIGAYLGLVPCEYSSGDTRVQGGVTKTGNGHARRLLVEAAWHHRGPYRPSRDLRARWTAAPAAAQARGHAANHRLHDRWTSFDARKKRSVVANAAIARELAGWCWSLAVLDD